MAQVLLIETVKDSQVARFLRSLDHSIIRIYFEEGAELESKIDIIPDIVIWDEDIDYSPLRFINVNHSTISDSSIQEIVLLKSYNTQFLRSWLGGNHYGFLLRPVTESAVITLVENALTQSNLHLSESIPGNYLERETSYDSYPQKKLLNQRNFLSNVIDSLRMPFIVIDAHTYEINLANAEAMRLAVGSDTHCYELSHNRLAPCSGKDHECPLTHVVETGEPYSTEHHHKTVTGEDKYVEVRGYPIKDDIGNVTHIIEYENDITDRYLYQEKLESAKRAAEAANQAKSQFIANMSHELRTPLNIILGFSELLTQEEKDADKREKLESVEKAGKNLLAIINDILDFSQIESNKLKLENEPFSLHSLLMHQYTFFSRQLSSKKIDFNTYIDENMPKSFYGDQHRVHQIVINLVSNAIKFTHEGHVTLKSSYVGGKVFIEVSDTGIGIAPERYKQLFTPFEQIDGSTNRAYSGTGLGLAIAKSLVDEMNGSIDVQSTPGKGSKFTVKLPLVPVQTELDKEEPIQMNTHDSANEGLHILVAEDNKVNQQLMKMIIENMGHTCDIAPEGKSALELLRKNTYDLAILDMHMPIMNGYQLVREIRADEQLKNLVVFALSAATGQGETSEFFEIGCDDFIPKPIDVQQLDKKIKATFAAQ